jgi:3-hydroxyacyl-CoA dehydrogenase
MRGSQPATVDEAMLAFGMPMGPIELVDMVGLDVVMAAGKSLAGADAEPPKCLLERFNAGHLGKKSGRGFYDYSQGRPPRARQGRCRPAWLSASCSRCSNGRNNWWLTGSLATPIWPTPGSSSAPALLPLPAGRSTT